MNANRWGEEASAGATPPARSRADLVLTIVLLVALVALGGVAAAYGQFLEEIVDELHAALDLPARTVSLALWGTGITVLALVVVGAAIASSVALLRRNRIAAWVPFAAIVLGSIGVVSLLVGAVGADPVLAAHYGL